MKTFGEFISENRRKKGITLRKLGSLVNISASYLSEIENGSKMPPREEEKLENLAIVLGLDFSELKKRAELQRITEKSTGIFGRLFATNNELAMSLYRQTEDKSEEDLNELTQMIEKAILEWKEKQTDGK